MNKEDILREICRTAEQNNGLPLGKQRFYQETGIKENDWSGKYWAKWGDAIIEAGYEPNEMNTALPDEYILSKYIDLLKELNRIPTFPEIRLKARQISDFPSHNTFKKFGNKNKLLIRLIKYCEETNQEQSILNLLKENVKEESEIKESGVIIEDGYVYLLQFGEEYKIGSSNNVERRFREIKTQMPYDGKIIHTIQTGDPMGIELYWHSFFKDKRLKGEWFKLTNKDIAYFKKRKLM